MTELHHVCLDCGSVYEGFGPWPSDACKEVYCRVCGARAFDARIVEMPAPAPVPSSPAPNPATPLVVPKPAGPSRPKYIDGALALVATLYVGACCVPAINPWTNDPEPMPGWVCLLSGLITVLACFAFPICLYVKRKLDGAGIKLGLMRAALPSPCSLT